MKNYISTILSVVVLTLPATAYANEPSTQLYTASEYPEHYCLAQNIYFEARGSSLADQAGVANVVMNRVNDRRYPDTICDVVYQGIQDSAGNMVRHRCQFSWYCDGKSDVPTDTDMWVEAQMLAWYMIEENKYRGLTEGATHYHADYVNPHWARDLQLVGRIGEHIFYRWE
jgi:spore germination cell wall hydrolase CwlJ-like protein